ncbi:MAG TPA: hypothetical protein VFS39_02140 [Nitrospira sp.]|nr:hypothetical protein [Nitrospira sp.]
MTHPLASPPGRLLLGCLSLLLLSWPACSRWIELKPEPGQPSASFQTIDEQEQVPLLLDRVRVTRNGAALSRSPESEQRLLDSLSDLGLFARPALSREPGPSQTKLVHASLLVDEAVDPHPGETAFKSLVIGASMFLLTPLLPLHYDYTVQLTLELERWDGTVKQYRARSGGTARYHLFGATPILVEELSGQVTESCLAALMQQVAEDTPFYAASSAPLPDHRIRTVAVKGRRPEPPAVPAVPAQLAPLP